MLKTLTTLLALAIALGGCAHGLMRGSVAMKVSDREAHVCMNRDEVKVGDRVALYRNDCPSKGGRVSSSAGATCQKKFLGDGTVTEIINDHYSLVKFDEGVQFEEGTFVEKR